MTHRLTLVSCSAQKRPHPAPARDLYRSPLFLKTAAYAQALGDPWAILSAGYGLIDPDTVINPYNQSLSTASTADLERWDAGIAAELLGYMASRDIDRMEVTLLAGWNYAGWVPAVEADGRIVVHDPLTGMAIGKRLQWLQQQVMAAS